MKRVDTVVALYLAVTAFVIAAHARSFSAWPGFVVLHLGLAGLVYALRFLPPRPAALRWLRDWYPAIAFPLLYKEVELLAAAFGNWELTEVVQSVETAMFGGHPSLYLSAGLPSVLLSEYLHLCYLSFVLWIPLIGGYWYFTGRRHAYHDLLLLVSLAFATSYLFYILFPVDSPFYLFEPLGRPLEGKPFYEIVHFVSSRGGARGGAFPSTHVSVSTLIWLAVFRHSRRLALWLVPVYVGLVVATVYGRFHYVVDVLAGWCVALLLFRLKTELERRLPSRERAGRETAPPPNPPPQSRAI